jgi:hypothetical protein
MVAKKAGPSKALVAKVAFSVTQKDGSTLLVHEGEEHPASSAIVKGRRELFEAKK